MADLTARPRLLFLCQTLPYPPDGGVWIRTYHVLRLLAGAFDITALCFERAGRRSHSAARDTATSLEALGRLAKVELFDIPQKHSRLRYVWDHSRSVASGQVYTKYLYDSPSFRRRLDYLLGSTSFDLVHVDSLDLAGYLVACRSLPVVCVHHDVESDLLRRRAFVERTQWRRAYLKYQASLMSRVEQRWCQCVALNVVVSERDRGLVKRLAPDSRVTIVPNGVDLEEFRTGGPTGTGVAFVGGTSPFPNADALDFFCEQILPHLRASAAHVRARWIGRASPEQQRYYRERYGIELTGYVQDARPLMGEAACHIVPLRAAGGTRLKILNAWAMGKAVVSTSVGCEGLETVDGDNILIRDEPESFANAVGAVLKNEALRRRLGERGRVTAERLYSWDALGERMVDTYLSLVNATRTVPAEAEWTSHRAPGSRHAPRQHLVRDHPASGVRANS